MAMEVQRAKKFTTRNTALFTGLSGQALTTSKIRLHTIRSSRYLRYPLLIGLFEDNHVTCQRSVDSPGETVSDRPVTCLGKRLDRLIKHDHTPIN